jgi:hypothetical protein
MATLVKKREIDPPEVDQPDKKLRKSLSRIQNQSEFNEMCADIGKYHVDIDSQGNFALPTPLPVNDADLRRIIGAIAPGLSECARAVHIDSEASRYPFLYEMLKTLVRLTGSTTVSAHNKTVLATTEDEEALVSEIAEGFERESLSDQSGAAKEESTAQMLMRWERYFKEKGGYKSAGFGYVEFSVEERNQLIRCLLECKDFLRRSSGPPTAAGFWQACGEAVTAQQNNIAQAVKSAGELAHAVALAAYAEPPSPPGTLSKAAATKLTAKYTLEKERALASAKKEAEKQAAELQLHIPVFVVLTDVREWIFLKLEGRTITYSVPYAMFDVNQGELLALPGLKMGLQFMCHAIGISSARTNVENRLAAAAQCTAEDSANLIKSVYPPEAPPTLKEAAAYLKGTISLLSPEAHKAAFASEYPTLDYQECMASLHAKL